jgi:hypothetical protein
MVHAIVLGAAMTLAGRCEDAALSRNTSGLPCTCRAKMGKSRQTRSES